MADDNYPLGRIVLPDQAFEELTDVSNPLQLKKLNDELRLLHLMLGYGLTPTGQWMSGGTSGAGVEINGEDVFLTVKNIFMAAQNAGGDADFILSNDGSGVGQMNITNALRVRGRRLVLPTGEWVMRVAADAPYTYGNPVRMTDADVTADHYGSLYAALRDVPPILMGNLTIFVFSQSGDADYEPVIISGVNGAGALVIGHASGGRIRASALYVEGCAAPVAISNLDVLAQAYGDIWWPDAYGRPSGYNESAAAFVSAATLYLSGCRFAGMSSICVYATDGASLYAASCTTRNGVYAFYAENNARISLMNCMGGVNHTYASAATRGGIISGIGTVPYASQPWRRAYTNITITPTFLGDMPTPGPQTGLPNADAAYSWAVNQITTNVNAYVVAGINSTLNNLANATAGAVNTVGRDASNVLTDGLLLGSPTMSDSGAGGVPVSATLARVQYSAVDTGTYAYAYLPGVSDMQQGAASNGREAIGLMWFPTVSTPPNYKSVRLTLTRAEHRGNPGPTPIQITGFIALRDRSEAPRRIKDYGVVGFLSWGETRSVTLPAEAGTDLEDGTITALGVYYGEQYEAAILGLPPYTPTLEFWGY